MAALSEKRPSIRRPSFLRPVSRGMDNTQDRDDFVTTMRNNFVGDDIWQASHGLLLGSGYPPRSPGSQVFRLSSRLAQATYNLTSSNRIVGSNVNQLLL